MSLMGQVVAVSIVDRMVSSTKGRRANKWKTLLVATTRAPATLAIPDPHEELERASSPRLLL